MILDYLDIHIIKSLLLDKKGSTWEIAKSFGWEDKPSRFENNLKRDKFFTNKLIKINYRMKKFIEEGIMRSEKIRNKNQFILDGSKCFICKHRFPPTNKTSSYIHIQGKDNKIMIFEL